MSSCYNKLVQPREDFVIFNDKYISLSRFIEGGEIKRDIILWKRKTETIEETVPDDYCINRAEKMKSDQ